MPKTSRQKGRILCLMQYLLDETDYEHPASVPEILDYLEGAGYSAERKSIYDDIEALNDFGFEILHKKGRDSGYYIAERDFQLAELKLLVDCVQSSRFITAKKSLELIKKLERLANRYDAQKLQRQVYVSNRVKNNVESIYYAVDSIHQAISSDKQISFKYTQYTTSKKRIYKKGGANYTVSPFALTVSEENYYLIAYDEDSQEIRHYRVDRMEKTSVLDAARNGKDKFDTIDMGEQSSSVFGMFSGEEKRLNLKFNVSLMGAVIDRFGEDVTAIASGENTVTVCANVCVSPQFFAWISGFGDKVEILSPIDVREQFSAYIDGILRLYK